MGWMLFHPLPDYPRCLRRTRLRSSHQPVLKPLKPLAQNDTPKTKPRIYSKRRRWPVSRSAARTRHVETRHNQSLKRARGSHDLQTGGQSPLFMTRSQRRHLRTSLIELARLIFGTLLIAAAVVSLPFLFAIR